MRDDCFAALVSIGLLLAACQPAPASYRSSFLAMGTRIDVEIVADAPQPAARLASEVERRFLQWGREWYPWGSVDGELKHLNAALRRGETLRISPELRELLLLAQTLQQRSEGYFDPAVAPMVQAWGFTDMNRVNALPSAAQLAAWRGDHATLADLVIDGDNASSPRRDLQLDLGAIAKGYAVDLALQRLQAAGVTAATLNVGGELRVIGRDSHEVDIRDPRAERTLASLQLVDGESIATSGDYERFAMLEGRRIHHLLDPHSGEPVAHTQAVTVIAATAALADAASTALMAAGPQHWQHIARQLGITQALRIDGSGAIEVSEALYARLHWNERAALGRRITRVAWD